MTVQELFGVIEEGRFVLLCDKYGNFLDSINNDKEILKKWKWRDYEVAQISITPAYHDLRVNIDYCVWG